MVQKIIQKLNKKTTQTLEERIELFLAENEEARFKDIVRELDDEETDIFGTIGDMVDRSIITLKLTSSNKFMAKKVKKNG